MFHQTSLWVNRSLSHKDHSKYELRSTVTSNTGMFLLHNGCTRFSDYSKNIFCASFKTHKHLALSWCQTHVKWSCAYYIQCPFSADSLSLTLSLCMCVCVCVCTATREAYLKRIGGTVNPYNLLAKWLGGRQCCLCLWSWVWPGTSYWWDRFSTVDLLVVTSLDQLHFILKSLFIIFTKQATLVTKSTVLNHLFQLVLPTTIFMASEVGLLNI
jgi:hypothetical protein